MQSVKLSSCTADGCSVGWFFRQHLRNGLALNSITAKASDRFDDKGLPSNFEVHELRPSNWTLHDPSTIVALNDWLLLAVTGKENENGYACGLELWYLSQDSVHWQFGQCLLTEKPT